MNMIKRIQNPLTSALIHSVVAIMLFIMASNKTDEFMRVGGIVIGLVFLVIALRQSVLAFEALGGGRKSHPPSLEHREVKGTQSGESRTSDQDES